MKPIADAAEPQRVVDRGGQRLVAALPPARLLALLSLRISGTWPAIVGRARLDQAERRRVGGEPGLDRQLELVVRVVGRRGSARSCAPARARSPGRPAGSPACRCRASRPCISIRARLVLTPGIVALVPGEDLLDLGRQSHVGSGSLGAVAGLRRTLQPRRRDRKRGGAKSLHGAASGHACAASVLRYSSASQFMSSASSATVR